MFHQFLTSAMLAKNNIGHFFQGNYKNQVTVFDNKVCDYLDFMLHGSLYVGCSEIEVKESQPLKLKPIIDSLAL